MTFLRVSLRSCPGPKQQLRSHSSHYYGIITFRKDVIKLVLFEIFISLWLTYEDVYWEKLHEGGVLGLFALHVCGYCSDRPGILTLWRGVLSRSKKSKIKWIGCLSVENEPPTFWAPSIWTDFSGFSIVFLYRYRKTMENQSNRGPPKCRRLVLHAQTSDSLNFWFFGTAY